MKKGYYIHWNARHMTGLSKKIDSQMYVFERYFEIKEINLRFTKSYLKNVGWILPFGSAVYDYQEAKAQMTYAPDFLYVRSGPFDRNSYRFMMEIIRSYPKCVILVELPNWPKSLRPFLSVYTAIPLIKERLIYEPLFRRHISRFVTFDQYDLIFGIPTIKTKNPIVVDQIKLPQNEKKDEDIRLLSVSHMEAQHGYERLIIGLYNYYKEGGKRRVILDMVGHGVELHKYKKLSERYGLTNNVIFYGEIVGKELEDIYAEADIALGIFGLFRIKDKVSSAIKVREYLSYGLPVISGCKEDFVEEGHECEFYRQYPNDPSPVDIGDVVCFYDSLMKKYSRNQLRHLIHEYAKRTVDAEVLMKPIVDYIEIQ